ncbi:DUF6440 family protein [uncultured Adlercreutzia sp.]|uniref:DUF6440 family protein n=1 Tax=uncultured Adlercreutzia sp. TaxID=875803 RepID=UPI00258A91CE|nr:DUF6440 family protein [uncultured Adlercreutzia sp.]
MKKAIIAAALTATMLLTGCSSDEASGEPLIRFGGTVTNISLVSARIITDNETGVQYLFVSDGDGQGGLTVLVDADGRPLIADEADHD